ncbi:MAG: hypothetical protein KF852_05695 [Saprospiraceae bacterium]|nr:hypothetical protein [Saprospiraceae bacterium]
MRNSRYHLRFRGSSMLSALCSTPLALCLLPLALSLLYGCTNSSPGEKADPGAFAQEEPTAAQPIANQPVEPYYIPANALRLKSNAYDHTVLLPLFPPALAGMQRNTLNGESYTMGAGLVAALSAAYSTQDRRLSVSLHDVGDQAEILSVLADWTALPEEENPAVERRSFLYKGQPALIRYGPGRMGTFNVLWNNRFVISIAGRNIGIADLERAMDELQIERLK